jgi:hypothetical protein
LAKNGSWWFAGGRKFLFPMRGLDKLFHAKYLNGLTALLVQGLLVRIAKHNMTSKC